jgi:hypothetical protein
MLFMESRLKNKLMVPCGAGKKRTSGFISAPSGWERRCDIPADSTDAGYLKNYKKIISASWWRSGGCQ